MKPNSLTLILLLCLFAFGTFYLIKEPSQKIDLAKIAKVGNSAAQSISPPPKEVKNNRESASSMQPRSISMQRLSPLAESARVPLSLGKANLVSAAFLEDTPWKIWAGVTAVKKSAGAMPSFVVGEVNGFYLFEDATYLSEVSRFAPEKPLVVVDQRLGRAGVLTGVFAVTLKQGVPADFLSGLTDIKVMQSFPEIRTYFITSAVEPFDLEFFKESLQRLPDVERFEIEVLSRDYEKN